MKNFLLFLFCLGRSLQLELSDESTATSDVSTATSDVSTATSVVTTTTTTRTTTVPIRCYNQFCMCTGENLVCDGFDSFDKLRFLPDPTRNYTFSKIVLTPTTRLFLNERLDFNGVSVVGTANIQISFIDGFVLGSSPFSTLKVSNSNNKALTAEFVESILKFEFSHRPVNSNCSSSLPSEALLARFLANVKTLNLRNVQIPEPICPYIFKNLSILTLRISNPAPNSRIEFLKLENENPQDPQNITYELNCQISNYYINNANIETVDAFTNVLNYELFRRTTLIDFLNSSIGFIQPNTFYYFGSLKTLKLRPLDWSWFLLVNHNTQWMYGLNYNASINLSNPNDYKGSNYFNLHLGFKEDPYDYPIGDFCFFADMPHFRRLLPVVNFKFRGVCSCTLISILQYSKFYTTSHTSEYQQSVAHQQCLRGNYNKTISDCELEKRVETDCKNFMPTTRPISTTTTPTTINNQVTTNNTTTTTPITTTTNSASTTFRLKYPVLFLSILFIKKNF